jgi:hypothetical protein
LGCLKRGNVLYHSHRVSVELHGVICGGFISIMNEEQYEQEKAFIIEMKKRGNNSQAGAL